VESSQKKIKIHTDEQEKYIFPVFKT